MPPQRCMGRSEYHHRAMTDQWRIRRSVALVFAFLALAALIRCGTSTGRADAESSKSETWDDRAAPHPAMPSTKGSGALLPGRPVAWIVVSHPEENRFRIKTPLLGWCPAVPHSQPRIAGVREVDRRRAVILTAYLVNGRPPLGCGEVAYKAEFVVNLRARRSGLPLYDGSEQPPVRRWP